MKIRTHVATALIVSYVIYYMKPCNGGLTELLSLLAISGLSQYFLDRIGHTIRTHGGVSYLARNAIHSLPGVTLLGLALGSPFLLWCPLYTLAVVIGMLLHLVEDMVTEGGVYLMGDRRRKLPVTFRYDDPLANRVAVLLAMILLSLTWPPSSLDQIIGLAIVGGYAFLVFLSP